MLGFHSQNVLQILENMKPIIFRIGAGTGQSGSFNFNKVEGMTLLEAFNNLVSSGYLKEGSAPVIPVFRISSDNGGGYDYTYDIIGFPILGATTGQIPNTIRIFVPAVGKIGSNRANEFYWPVTGNGGSSYEVFQGITLTKSGSSVNIQLNFYED